MTQEEKKDGMSPTGNNPQIICRSYGLTYREADTPANRKKAFQEGHKVKVPKP